MSYSTTSRPPNWRNSDLRLAVCSLEGATDPEDKIREYNLWDAIRAMVIENYETPECPIW